MKFNLTKDRLTRILLSANPILANCKGSKKAVRLMLNMLGMKCIITQGLVHFAYAVDGLEGRLTNNEFTLSMLAGEMAAYANSANDSRLRLMDGEAANLLGVYDNDTLVQVIQVIAKYTSSTCATFECVPLTSAQIEYWNAQHDTRQITPASKSKTNGYLCVAYSIFANSFNRLVELYNAPFTTDANVTTANNSSANDEFTFLITNVTDSRLQPVKSVLAKQMQEILPINMIVEADNIIGCAIDE